MSKKPQKKSRKKTSFSKKEMKQKVKMEKQKAKEKEKKAMEQEKINAKEAKEQAKIEAEKAKEQVKIDKKKTKEQAKIDAKKAKEFEKESKKRIKEKEKEIKKIRRNKGSQPLPNLPRGMSIKTWYTNTFKMKYRPNEDSVYTNIKKKRMEDRVKIFLSHPNQDKVVRKKIHSFSDYLSKQKDGKYAPWCDKDYLGKPGRDLNEGLVHDMIQGLEESDIVLVGLPAGPVSNWIIAENEQAKTMRKRILIVTFGKAVIRKGMVRSEKGGHVNIPENLEEWEERIIETIEENLTHNSSRTFSYKYY